VKALKDGAFDYVTKPFDPDDLSHLIRNASKQIVLQEENETLKDHISSLERVEDLAGRESSRFTGCLMSVTGWRMMRTFYSNGLSRKSSMNSVTLSD